MGKAKTVIVLTLCCSLMGCATTTMFSVVNKLGEVEEVVQIDQDSRGLALIETPEGYKASIDTRQLNFWERNIVPIFQGTVGRVQPEVSN